MSNRPVFAVCPVAEFAKRSVLFASLGRALGVRFAATPERGIDAPAGKIRFSSDDLDIRQDDVPTLTIIPPQVMGSSASFSVELSDAPELEPLVRKAIISEVHSWHPSPIPTTSTDAVLAQLDGRPAWVRRPGGRALTEIVSGSLDELSQDEILRDRLSDGNAFALLSILHFVRSVLGSRGVTPPRPRAAFVIDDPNLRTFSYGFIHFPSLVRLAERHNFHVVLATIPLDMWWISKNVARFVRKENKHLSLALHGNNHIGSELNRPVSPEVDLASMAQAVRRAARYEEHYGVPVSRVMVPPHEAYCRSILGILKSVGIDALCASWPVPCVPREDRREVPKLDRLLRWLPATSVDGMAIIHRQWMRQDNPTKNFLFDAMLGQPLIPYFHHGDFRHGYERLCDLAGTINRLGDVHWQSLSEIAGSNFDVQQQASTLRIRPFSHRIDVQVPEGIDHLIIEAPNSGIVQATAVNGQTRTYPLTATEEAYETTPIAVTGGTRARLVIRDEAACDPNQISGPPFVVGPVMRRALTEARDRLAPFFYRRSGRPAHTAAATR